MNPSSASDIAATIKNIKAFSGLPISNAATTNGTHTMRPNVIQFGNVNNLDDNADFGIYYP
jgi:hypothetical protein